MSRATIVAGGLVSLLATPGPLPCAEAPAELIAQALLQSEIVDLSVTVAENYPAHWPTHGAFQKWTFNWFEPVAGSDGDSTPSAAPYFGVRMVIDDHTGTQLDFPAHFIPPEGSGLPHAAAVGNLNSSNYPLERQMGPAAVIDVRSTLEGAENGKSPRITVELIQSWEREHGEVDAGEVVVFFSGYSDAHYKPFPEGNRLAFDPLILQSAPGWPAPTPEAVEYLHGKGVWHLATDGPSMGYVDGGQATHVAGLQHGMSWTEFCTNLGRLPARGAFFLSIHPRIDGASGGLARAIAIKDRGARGVGE